ncbi:hypothetical protein Naga_101219g1 [Nannochloropsis gaditana]|uniref:Uncharacterized protein n=1 Tax=Nannochloropsis gaditana TaxID=72520 RepID=W7T6R4_9STRA|nr:hypothetical protein Naga_101219g1 [Nannochloropsis gaditana]
MLEEMQRQEEEQRRMPVVVVSQHANSDTGSKTKPVVMRGKDGELQFPGREEGSGDHGGTGAAESLDSCLDVFNGARYFAVTGILLAYHETEVEADPVEKTAFVRKFREYEFRRAMLGVRNLPGFWRRLADLVFRGLTWIIRVVFFDPKLAR